MADAYMNGESREVVQSGTMIDGYYRIEKQIGSGQLGMVWEARDEKLDRKVAIKFLRPHLLTHSSVERFLAQAQIMAQVNHPNVIHVYDFGKYENLPYFVMEFAEGRSFETILEEMVEPMATDHAIGLLEQCCDGLAAIHAKGVRHGGIKPSNLLMGPNFTVSVGDIGLNEFMSGHDDRGIQSQRDIRYMAPEVIAAQTLPPGLLPRADVYSLAVIAYELLAAGQSPYHCGGSQSMVRAHLSERPCSILDQRPDLPAEIDQLFARALAKDASMRLSIEELRDELRKLRQERRPTEVHRVLVVDDDPQARELIRHCLTHALGEIEILEAASGDDALKKLVESKCNTVITDLDLPEGNGIELTASIKAIYGDSVRILVVTGEGGANDWRVLQSLGAESFFVKPLQPATFVEQIREYFPRK